MVDNVYTLELYIYFLGKIRSWAGVLITQLRQ
jgi:hypothetical protein